MNNNSLKNLNYNHTPLNEKEVTERFLKCGYKIIKYNYKNNQTRIPCFDRDGYKVMVSLSSLSKNIKQYQRFSTTCNLENFKYNVELFIKNNKLNCQYLDWRKSKTKNHIDISLKCSCGNIYWIDFNWWKKSLKCRCNNCVKNISNIELKTKQWLDEMKIKYIQQYKFNDCIDKRALPFDFYLTDFNICIEVDGEQHFNNSSIYYNNKNGYNDRLKKDNIKNDYCKNNNIKLIRLKYNLFYSDLYKKILKEEIYNN